MDGMLRYIDFAFVYLDDILIASPDAATHKIHLRKLFRLLSSNGISLNKKKCTLGQSQVRYLGHLVSAAGIAPLPARVQDMLQFPAPVNRLGVQRFLGMINYYRRFIPRLASSLGPLHALAASKTSSISWSSEADQAFKDAKSSLASAVLLHHPNPFSATCLAVDASDVAVGAELAQRDKAGHWCPLAFFSHSLSSAERKYSALDRELLAMYLAVRHFRHHLEGRKFFINTDHKPLTFAFTSGADRSPRQTRHLSYIAEFTSDVRHIKGTSNVVADTLSRPAIFAVTGHPEVATINFAALARAQDPSSAKDTSLVLSRVVWNNVAMWCDTSTELIRPLVPVTFRKAIFDAIHGLSHGGSRPTTRAILARYIWPGAKKDIRQWCRTCMPCQVAKVGRHTKTPVSVFPSAKRRFGSIHVDLVGPLPSSERCKYLLTIVDRFSRWPEAFPLQDMSSNTCARAFVRHWLPRFGIPDEVITDRGTQFVGGAWAELMTSLGVKSLTTTAYHPQCNGLVERLHRTLKAAIRARLVDSDWQSALPLVLLGLRSAWKEGQDSSPADLVYGVPLRLPGQFIPGAELSEITPVSSFVSTFQTKMREQRPVPSKHHAAPPSFIPPALKKCTSVFVRYDGVRRPLQNPYDGPYQVLESGDKYFKNPPPRSSLHGLRGPT